MGGRLLDWLGQGVAADRPLAAAIVGLTSPGGAAIYYAKDTKILSIYDDALVAWLDIDVAAFATFAFQTLPDVDWSTPPTDGQFFVWDAASSKFVPSQIDDGAGLTITYNNTTKIWEAVCNITQYTDELAMDAIAVMIAAGTHVGISIAYDDVGNKLEFTVSSAFVNGLADARIAAASINALADVDTMTSAPAVGEALAWDGTNFVPTPMGGAGQLLGRQVIAATGAGVYTPTAGTNSIVLELVGAGGGAGGNANPGAGLCSRSCGGGGGAYLQKRLTADFSGAAYVVGAKGIGGVAGANPGNNGGDTTFTTTGGAPVVYTAGGGLGGVVVTPSAPTSLSDYTAGGVATNGDINMGGGIAGIGLVGSTAQVYSGCGGTSRFSVGGKGARNGTVNVATLGANAGGKGGGGSACAVSGTGGAQAGGNGSDGLIIIWEYS